MNYELSLTNFNEHDDFLFEDAVERKVLWDIESTLEKSLIEPLRSDYRLVVKQAREEVRNNKELSDFQEALEFVVKIDQNL